MGKIRLGFGVLWLCLLAFVGCAADPSGTTGQTACVSDQDCAGGRCDARLGCVACLFDTHCGDGQRCDHGSCATRVSCVSSGDCTSAAAPACDLALQECFACAADADCKTGEKCEGHACRSFSACKNSLDCAAGQVCGNESECVECVGDADCEATATCVRGTCEPRCASDKDCAASGRLCAPGEKHCVECVSQGDCPGRYHCSAGSCERDACEESASRCTDSGSALESCAVPGNAWIKLFCVARQSCRELGGQARCEAWLCTPGSTQCSADGRRRQICNADGLGTTVAEECGPTQACVDSACKDVQCEPKQVFCRGGDLYQCNADGTSATRERSCGEDTYCDAAAGACRPRVCTPGDRGCADGQAGRCKPDGSGFEIVSQCGQDQVCRSGNCVDLICDPQSYACEADGRLTRCDATGTFYSTVVTCGSDEYCNADAGACLEDACAAGQSVCVDDVVATCNDSGSGFEGDGTDCGASGQVCSAGACKPKVCEQGTRFCQDGSVRLCVKEGSSSQLFDACDPDEFCDADAALCKKRTCVPNAPSCEGQVAATCNATGSGYLTAGAVSCSATGKVCDAGVCKTKVCNPGATLCQGGNVHQCNSAGSATTLLHDCSVAAYFCASAGDSASCSWDVCVAGALACSGNHVTQCNAEGSGYQLGADCGAKACVEGVCTTKICTPETFRCVGANSQVCDSNGTAWSNVTTCNGDTYCSAATGHCELDSCPPAAKACLSEKLGTCTADGSSLGSAVTDCKATSKLCTLAGCATAATDALGDEYSYYPAPEPALFGNVVYVTSSRKLTELKQAITWTIGPVRFLVYASNALAGPYVPVFDVSSAESDDDLKTSGPIALPLTAGKYYFFGALTAGYFYMQENAGVQYTSFGRALGSHSQRGANVPVSFSFTSSTSLANVQLTTVLP